MKNLGIYYIAILMPIPLVIWSAFYNPVIFSVLLFSYLVYRSFTDGQRLIDKGILEKNKIWKAFIPFWTSRYFKDLYFN